MHATLFDDLPGAQEPKTLPTDLGSDRPAVGIDYRIIEYLIPVVSRRHEGVILELSQWRCPVASFTKEVKGTAHLKQHSYQMAIFSSGMKIFKIAFQHVVGNSCMVPIAPFSAINFNHMTLF